MNPAPLIKTKLSNERLMSALLLVLLLYNLPRFFKHPGDIPALLLLVAIGLVVDTATHFFLYKRPFCAVSAAVTALILYSLSPGAAFWAECVALLAALIAGKAVWGGTGKNPLNPAMVGLLLLALISPYAPPAFEPTLLLLPAVILSLPFLLMRPYAGAGMALGMAAALLARGGLSFPSLLSWGVLFWSCLVITDPVTTTAKPAAGFALGVLCGFVPLLIRNTALSLPLGVLLSNALSVLADRLLPGKQESLRKTFGKRQRISFSSETVRFVDLAGDGVIDADIPDVDCGTLVARIDNAGVTGCGGAAFPTAVKLRAVLDAEAPEKHLIVNAAECDPGLLHDKWLLKNRAEDIARGVALLRQCVPFASVTAAAKHFDGDAFGPEIKQYQVRDWYPAGAEKILIRDVLGVSLAPAEIPSKRGILVLNVQTVLAVLEAAGGSRRSDTRYITAADLLSGSGAVVRVRLGDGVYETALRLFPKAVSVFTGGGAMSARLASDGSVIDKKTNFIAVGAVPGFREALCSRCNFCAAYCPMGLPVRELARLVDEGKTEQTARLHPESCIECNLCSSVCPAGRDQARRVREAKSAVRGEILS